MLEGKKSFKERLETYIASGLQEKKGEDVLWFRNYLIVSFRVRMGNFVNGEMKQSQTQKVKDSNRNRIQQLFPFLTNAEVEQVTQMVPHKIMVLSNEIIADQLAKQNIQNEQSKQDEARVAQMRRNNQFNKQCLPLIIQ